MNEENKEAEFIFSNVKEGLLLKYWEKSAG